MTTACVAGEVVSAPEPMGDRSWAPGPLGARLAAALDAAAACLAEEMSSLALAYAAPAPCAAAAAAFVGHLQRHPRRVRPSDSLDLEPACALYPFLASHPHVQARYVVVTPRWGSYQVMRWAVAQVAAGCDAACLVVEAVWSAGPGIEVAAVVIGRPGAVAGTPVVLEPRPDWSLADLRARTGAGR